MKKKIILLVIFLITICFFTTYTFATDYNDGTTGSLSGLGEGAWDDTPIGIRVSIVNSSGELKIAKRVLSNQYSSDNSYTFNVNNKPKFLITSSDKINLWSSSKDYIRTSALPNDYNGWLNTNNVLLNLNSHLQNNDYENLKTILSDSSFSNKIGAGDFIVIEPMTRVGIYFGTAYELGNSFWNDSVSKKYGTFANTYAGALYGGFNDYNRPNGGLFYNTIYLQTPVTELGLTVYTDPETDKYTARNNCLKSKTCGRGIGVYRYEDVYKEEINYMFDVNIILDGKILYSGFTNNTLIYTMKRNGKLIKDKNGTDSYGNMDYHTLTEVENTKYEITDIAAAPGSIYEYQGYKVDLYPTETNQREYIYEDKSTTSYTVEIKRDVSIYIYLESSCSKQLATLKKSDGTYDPKDLFELYKTYKDKNKDYRNLLNIANPSCTTKTETNKEIKNLTCLSGSTLSHANFNELNLTDYDEIITNVNGSHVGYCLTSIYLKNNLGAQTFYSKSGQFLVKEVEELVGGVNYKELEMYNSSYNPIRSCGNTVATSTIRRKCYILQEYTNSSYVTDQVRGISNDINVYFGDNDLNNVADKLEKTTSIESILKPTAQSTSNNLVLYDNKKMNEYYLNTLKLEKISGKVDVDGTILAKGVIAKFNESATSRKLPFKITVKKGSEIKTYGENEKLCSYVSEPEIVVNDKLNLEFRIIDTNIPFERTPNSNWNDGSGSNIEANQLIQENILNATNSYGMQNGEKKEPIYKIELTPNDIKNIREYNKNVPYDNYLVDCKIDSDNKKICKNTFLENLKNEKVIVTDNLGNVINTLKNDNKLLLSNKDKSNLESNSQLGAAATSGIDISKKICTPVTNSVYGKVPNGNYNIGDEYICEVAPGIKYNFFVIGTCGESKVNMIMSDNVNGNTNHWINQDDYSAAGGTQPWVHAYASWFMGGSYIKGNNSKGPITSLKELEVATRSWTNIVPYNYTLIDEINDFNNYERIGYYTIALGDNDPDREMYSPIELNNVRARLMSRNEANNCGCSRKLESCPSFLKANINTKTRTSKYGYWLSSAVSGYPEDGMDMVNDGGDCSTMTWESLNGVRAVITVYKSQIRN